MWRNELKKINCWLRLDSISQFVEIVEPEIVEPEIVEPVFFLQLISQYRKIVKSFYADN